MVDKFLSNSFFDLNQIKKAADNNKVKVKSNSFDLVFREALINLEKFINNPGKEKSSLKKTIENLSRATELSRNRFEPYYYLAYIAYLCEDFLLAEKYNKAAALIKPGVPRVIKLNNLIKKVKNERF